LILIDTNLLLYAYDTASPEHSSSKRWIESVFSGESPVLLPWQVILAFLRISTNPRAMESPLSRKAATSIVREWLDRRQVKIVEPGDRHWEILCDLIESAQATGPLVMDAHLAALAIENGATLCSADRDFTRFDGLDWRNPLADPS
jgi:hypothetical protein